MFVVYATANVSGGHVNPAVTLANCLTGHMSWGRGGLYMIAQVLGGIFGALIEVKLCLWTESGSTTAACRCHVIFLAMGTESRMATALNGPSQALILWVQIALSGLQILKQVPWG